MLPVLKNLLYITYVKKVWEKDINGVVYFWRWLLNTYMNNNLEFWDM